MATNIHNLQFDGYWRESNIDSMPAKSGIYCVFACKAIMHKNQVSIKQLIYIGQSEDVRKRIKTHEMKEVWHSFLELQQELCFSFTPVSTLLRVRLEAACIHEHKPIANSEYIDTFPFDHTTVTTSGKNRFLHERFIVKRKETNILGRPLR